MHVPYLITPNLGRRWEPGVYSQLLVGIFSALSDERPLLGTPPRSIVA